MLLLQTYVPGSHIDQLKTALFAAGAGRIGNYDSCCWQTLGTGQFRPLEDSNPYLGSAGKVEQLSEWKLELVVDESVITEVVAALKATHPYATPAYQVIRCEAF